MQKLTILNTREVKKIHHLLEKQFQFTEKLPYTFLLNNKDRLFIINPDLSRVDLDKLKVDRYGLYFGELKNQELRLSLEGAQLVGKKAKKNLLTLTKSETQEYFLGKYLEKDLNQPNHWLLLKYKKDILGCAKYKKRKIINFLPKIHRTPDIII